MALIAEEIKRDLLRKGLSVNDVLASFEGFDRNRDGVCSYKEFKRALTQLRINLHTKKLRHVWKMLDHDESGEVKYSEFAAALFPELEDDVLAEMLKEHAKLHSREPKYSRSHDAASFMSLLDSEDSIAGVPMSEISGRHLEGVTERPGGEGGGGEGGGGAETEGPTADRPAAAAVQLVDNGLSEASMIDEVEAPAVSESARLARLEEAMAQIALQQRGLQRTMDAVLALLRREPPSPPTAGAGVIRRISEAKI